MLLCSALPNCGDHSRGCDVDKWSSREIRHGVTLSLTERVGVVMGVSRKRIVQYKISTIPASGSLKLLMESIWAMSAELPFFAS